MSRKTHRPTAQVNPDNIEALIVVLLIFTAGGMALDAILEIGDALLAVLALDFGG